MNVDKILWYFNRLKAMSVPEISHRINKKIKMKSESKKYNEKIYINEKNNIDKNNIYNFEKRLEKIFDFRCIDINKYEVKDIVDIFNEEIDINQEINWHKCNFRNWDKDVYSNCINFKSTDNIGDVRYTWEINRHLFFSNLALNYKKTNDKKYLDLLEKHFYSWIKQNPFLKGVNWASPMEIAIRSYQWIITYSIIKDDVDEMFKVDIINSIINSIKYVSENYSLYSSANNHLIIEAVYCGIIGYLIEPIYSNNYFKESYNIIERELLLQNNKDGVNKEQATHYHAFVLDGYLQYAFFLSKIGEKFPDDKILFNMSEFIGLLKQSGKVIEFGDSDDAKLISFGIKTNEYYDYVLQLASVYFKTSFYEIKELLEEVKFISSSKNIGFKNHMYKSFNIYKDGGYAIFNINNNFMLFDIGELGFGSIAAHGHADALSIVYSLNGNPIFVDTGTYIYNVKSEWRDYFRSTSSHNTLTFKGKNQSEIKGPFLWGKRANVKLVDYGENDEIMYVYANHDGYKPNIHTRSITYLKKEDIFIIADNFEDEGTLNYILDKNLDIKHIDDKSLKIKGIEDDLFITFSVKYKESNKWISDKFLSKNKTKGIQLDHDFKKTATIYTIIAKKEVQMIENNVQLKGIIIKIDGYKSIRREYNGMC